MTLIGADTDVIARIYAEAYYPSSPSIHSESPASYSNDGSTLFWRYR